MKIWITGASGMVGRNLLESPQGKKHTLFSPTSKDVNLLSAPAITQFLKTNTPDLVIHAAGHVGGIQSNMIDKATYLEKNLLMGMNLIHAMREVGIKKLLNLGSSCMFPRNLESAIPESKILTGELEPTNEGYAIAKIAVAKMAEYVSIEHPEFHYKTIIPCNLYGRWDKFDPAHSHLVPAIILKIKNAIAQSQTEVEIWGNGEARREFMYAGDFAKIVFDLVDRFEDLPHYLNVGLGYDYSINEYYQAAAKVMSFKGKFVHNLNKPTGMKRKWVDISLLKGLGIHHDAGLESGIQNTVHFLEHQK